MDANQEVTERREMDIIISPYEVTGFHIRWINVTLKDGRRDWQGVTRRSTEVGFEPSDYGSFYVRDGAYDPFRTKDKFQPYLGSPVQWALLDEVGLHVYSFVIDDNGKFELQRYSRTLEDGRMHLEFERLDDGLVTRSIKGEAVRAETE